MSTVQSVIARFKISYPECSTLFALQLINDSTKSMSISSELRQVLYTVLIVNGVRTYILDPQIMLIKEAYFVRTATPGDQQVLYQTSDDWLAENRQGWLGFSWSGQPWNCYVGSTVADNSTVPATPSVSAPGSAMTLGFDPPPNWSSVNGYPCVQLYATTWIPFGLYDYLPDHLGPDQMWVDKLCRLYTIAHDLTQVQARSELAAESHQETIARMKNTQMQTQTQIVPGFMYRRRRT